MNQTITPIVIPLLVQRFVGDEHKGEYYGQLRLWALMVALLVQTLAGMFSDRSQNRLGRRRPFILTGTAFDLVFIFLIGLVAGYEGFTGYWLLFFLVILLNVSLNIAQAGAQGLIPDLVPEEMRGRFSGVKAFLELPLPLIIVAFTIGKLIKNGDYWGGLLVMAGILVICTCIAMLVKENPQKDRQPGYKWKEISRILIMAGYFLVIILLSRELLRLVEHLSMEIISPEHQVLIMGFSGFLAMAFAIFVGVWGSIAIGTGTRKPDPSFAWWVINRLAFFVAAFNLGSFIVYFLQARLSIVAEEAAGPASIIMMIIGICILFTAIPSGWLSDRFNRKTLVIIAGVLASIGAIAVVSSQNLAIMYISGGVIGIATGLFYTANWALGTSIVSDVNAGFLLGVSNLAGAGAGAIGAYIGGPIADHFTQYLPQVPGIGYSVIFIIYGALFGISALAALGINENKPVIRAIASKKE